MKQRNEMITKISDENLIQSIATKKNCFCFITKKDSICPKLILVSFT